MKKAILFVLFNVAFIVGYLVGGKYISSSIGNLLCVIVCCLFGYLLKNLD